MDVALLLSVHTPDFARGTAHTDISRAVALLKYNGQTLEGCVVPYEKGKTNYDVVVTMG